MIVIKHLKSGGKTMGKIQFSRMMARRGGTGVFLIVLLVVIFIAVGLVPWWIRKNTPDPDQTEWLTPWREWSIRESSKKPAVALNELQPKITEMLRFEAAISDLENNEDRGDVEFLISPDGQIDGRWSGNYYKGKKVNCDVTGARYEGSVYPGKIYKDEKGEDRSRLYFLTRGRYMYHEADFDTSGYKIRKGDIYVRGWIRPDFTVEGDVTIAHEDKTFERYGWKAAKATTKISSF
jgi:hypothetical protein